MKILILNHHVEDELLEKIRSISPEIEIVLSKTNEEAMREIEDAEVFFGLLPRDIFLRAKRLRWVQSSSAGMDRFLFPEIVESNVILTNASGVYATHVAEHAVALLLALTRGINISVRHQLNREWKGTGVVEVSGQVAGVIGMGGIGQAIAKRLHGLEMKVLGIDLIKSEKPDFVAELWKPDKLHDLLMQSDAVVIAVPCTPETEGMIGKAEFKSMKPSAFIVNIARGKIIDQAAMVQALKEKKIAGAGLDVFEKEPLPPDSELWGMENVVITPHAAGASQHRQKRIFSKFCENLKRYIAGQPLLNVVDKKRGF